jgi:hypothetical protein
VFWNKLIDGLPKIAGQVSVTNQPAIKFFESTAAIDISLTVLRMREAGMEVVHRELIGRIIYMHSKALASAMSRSDISSICRTLATMRVLSEIIIGAYRTVPAGKALIREVAKTFTGPDGVVAIPSPLVDALTKQGMLVKDSNEKYHFDGQDAEVIPAKSTPEAYVPDPLIVLINEEPVEWKWPLDAPTKAAAVPGASSFAPGTPTD